MSRNPRRGTGRSSLTTPDELRHFRLCPTPPPLPVPCPVSPCLAHEQDGGHGGEGLPSCLDTRVPPRAVDSDTESWGREGTRRCSSTRPFADTSSRLMYLQESSPTVSVGIVLTKRINSLVQRVYRTPSPWEKIGCASVVYGKRYFRGTGVGCT